ncbi:putative lipid II flippase FtsW [Rothia mucilaginosa]|uniref:Probable peptidoglycan glycosyltransferase FtsW n=1 Tax=Rothia mucilaginosa TaxID=43675 RepID=A0A943T6R6_9MICC|nr:putative lipid II flippase FtsW [Rothia mucilaginosa]MBS6634416.1 putative lipid II flippase FtsW [Rothia mucilaginosa]
MSSSVSSKRSASSRAGRSEQTGHASSPWTALKELTAPARSFGKRLYRRGQTADLWDVPVMLLVTTLGLAIFGCIMVLSASSVTMISQGQSPFSQVSSQILFLVLGVVAMAVITNIPVGWYHKRALVHAMLAVALVLQLAVVVVGVEVNGNRNWIKLGPMQMQPSEFSKLAIVMWLAWVYNRQGDISRSLWRALFPSIYGVGALILLIMVGGDMGTALVYGFIFLGMMWMAGASRRSMLQIVGAFLALAALGVLTSPNRVARIFGIWGSCTNANCDQANSGEVALATGGFLGVGLGQSRQKYNYLAEAHNDYIFAIIGEELGLLGTLAVLLLYVGLVYCAVRIMLRTADPLVRLATGGIMVWLTSQAIINMGMVSRILPVIGVPLPFVSYGGSSLLSSLCAAGLLLAFARQTPLRGATAPSNVENQSAREIRRANADWKRRLPLQAVVEQEAAERAEAGGYLMQERNPLSKLGGLSGVSGAVRHWLGFDPEQRRELKRVEQQREAERAREEARAAREEARLAREEAAREKAERQKLARRAREEAERQKAREEAERQKADREKATRTRDAREQKSREQKPREQRAPGAGASRKTAPRKAEQPRPARPVQRPAEQGSKEQQVRGRRPEQGARRRPQNQRDGLPAGLQPLHPEDRARRAQRQQRQHGQSPRRQPGGGER